MTPKKILFLVGDFVEDYEAMVPFQILTMFGHDVAAACPGKKAGGKVATAIHDFEGHQTYTEKPGHFFALNADFDSLDPASFDGLLIPGGRAPEYLRTLPAVVEAVKHFEAAKKPIGAICHGPQLLVPTGALQGKKCTAYPSVRAEIEACGGIWQDPGPGFDRVYTDGNLVTAPAWPANALWTKAFLELLGGWPRG